MLSAIVGGATAIGIIGTYFGVAKGFFKSREKIQELQNKVRREESMERYKKESLEKINQLINVFKACHFKDKNNNVNIKEKIINENFAIIEKLGMYTKETIELVEKMKKDAEDTKNSLNKVNLPELAKEKNKTLNKLTKEKTDLEKKIEEYEYKLVQEGNPACQKGKWLIRLGNLLYTCMEDKEFLTDCNDEYTQTFVKELEKIRKSNKLWTGGKLNGLFSKLKSKIKHIRNSSTKTKTINGLIDAYKKYSEERYWDTSSKNKDLKRNNTMKKSKNKNNEKKKEKVTRRNTISASKTKNNKYKENFIKKSRK